MIVLSGFADDLANLMSHLQPSAGNIVQVTENTPDADIPKKAEILVYVMSLDTGYSSQLHGVFAYLHHRITAVKEYLCAVEDIDLRRLAFPELSALPEISIQELNNFIQGGRAK